MLQRGIVRISSSYPGAIHDFTVFKGGKHSPKDFNNPDFFGMQAHKGKVYTLSSVPSLM